MRILGICHDVLTCSAALVADGHVLARLQKSVSIAESRVACSRRWPSGAASISPG
jgi:hypothetical protein